MKKSALVYSCKRSILFTTILLTYVTLKAQVPVISSFSPTSGPVGTTVTITGSGFSSTPGNNTVWFGAVKANVMAASTTELTVNVPVSATSEPVSVTTGGKTGWSKIPFRVTFSAIRNIGMESFASKIDYSTFLNPQDVALNDIDSDGKPDLMVTNSNSLYISVYRNKSESGIINYSSLADKVNIDSYSTPYRISAEDIDCDGKKDLIVANTPSTGAVSVFRNNSTAGSISTGSFDARIDFPTGDSSNDVAVSDIDQDGKPDLIVTNFNSNFISIYRNISSPGSVTAASFEARVDIPSAINLQIITVADIDGDSKPDMVVPNFFSGTVSVYRNISTPGTISAGSFDTKVDFITGMNPYAAAISDLDGDGKPEMIITNSMSNSVSVFKNISTTGVINSGSFQEKVDFYADYGPRELTVADINGDSKPELIISNSGNNKISILKNSCVSGAITSESFGNRIELVAWTSTTTSVVGDIDGDNKPDITVVNNGSNVISVFRNTMTVPVPPEITSFVPVSGPVGSVVTINGANFSSIPSENTVRFGTVAATVTNATTNQLTVMVPSGFTSQPVSVTVNELTVTSGTSFTVIIPVPPPVITSINPGSATVGTPVTITGSGFSTVPSENIVWFGAVRTTVTAASETVLTVTVPAGATYKPVSVTVNGLTSWSASPFNLLLDGPYTIDNRAFTLKTDFPAETAPFGLALSDIEGDGKPELIVSNSAIGAFSVFRNTSTSGSISAGSFSSRENFNTEVTTRRVAVGDLDGDGNPDIVLANQMSNSITVYRNNSTIGTLTSGFFGARIEFPAGAMPEGVAIGDIDGDGKADIAVTNYSGNTVSVFRNTSTPGSINSGSFAPMVDFPTNANPYDVLIEDIDRDGKSDLVISCFSGSVSVLRNTSTNGIIDAGTFTTYVGYGTLPNPKGIALGDIDGDGKPDLVVASNSNNSISVYRNTSIPGSPMGVFTAPVTFATLTAPNGIAIGDIDGDGKPDIAVANFTNKVSVFRNTSSIGSITSSSLAAKIDFTTGASPFAVTIGDIDGDGKPDLSVLNQSGSISVFRNKMSVSVPSTPPVINSFNPGSGPVGSSITIEGTNFGSTPADNIVWFGAVRATVTAASATQLTVRVPSGASYQPLSVTVKGLTAYSAKPFSVTFNTVKLVDLNAFAPKTDLNPVTSPGGIATSDIDGDGKPDLVISNEAENKISIYRNISTSGSLFAGSFSQKIDLDVAGMPKGIAIGDLDGDGKPDIVVSKNNGYVSVFHNDCNPGTIDAGSFGARVDYQCGGGPNDILIGEIDGDGKPEIIVSNWGSNTVSVFMNLSEPGIISPESFPEKYDLVTGSNPVGLSLGDIDGDNKSEVVVSYEGSIYFSVFRNTTTPGIIDMGSFGSRLDFGTIGPVWGISLADIDGDSKNDLIITNNTLSSISVFRNISTPGMINPGSFEPKIDFTTLNNPDHITIGDIDGDGKPDIAVTDFGSAMVSVFKNTSTTGSLTTGSLSARYDFSTGTNPRGIILEDLDGDMITDMAVTNFSQNTVSLFWNTLGVILPPQISSFTPSSGPVGSTVTINGSNFSTVPADNIVKFGTVNATVTSSNPNQLTVVVPAGFTSQPISVTVNTLTAISGTSFTILVPPSITSISPSVGTTGTSVIINGSNFSSNGSDNIVKFGNLQANLTASSTTQLTIIVPNGATTNPITVTVNGLTSNSSMPFTVLQPGQMPLINSIFPNSGPIGTTITISGMNFSPIINDNTVLFGTVQGTITSANYNQINVIVPPGGDGQMITIIVNGASVSSQLSFTATIPSDIELESTIMTPNGDGKNDNFKVRYFETFGISSLYVYNARGAVVYWNDNFNGEWDLRIKEKMLETGGYFYVLKTEIGTFRGSFSVLKE